MVLGVFKLKQDVGTHIGGWLVCFAPECSVQKKYLSKST